MRPSQWGNQREIRLMRQQEWAGRAGRSKAGAVRRQTPFKSYGPWKPRWGKGKPKYSDRTLISVSPAIWLHSEIRCKTWILNDSHQPYRNLEINLKPSSSCDSTKYNEYAKNAVGPLMGLEWRHRTNEGSLLIEKAQQIKPLATYLPTDRERDQNNSWNIFCSQGWVSRTSTGSRGWKYGTASEPKL